MPTNDLHRACGCEYTQDVAWGRAGALLGLGEGADPHPDAKRLCAEKDDRYGRPDELPLHWAAMKGAPAELIGRMLAVHAEAAAAKDDAGELPLDLAVEHKAAPEVLGLLRSASSPLALAIVLALQRQDWEAV